MIHQLDGIIKGVAIDRDINHVEIQAINDWSNRNYLARNINPSNLIIPKLNKAIKDGRISDEEKEDLLWFCGRFTTPNEFFTESSSDIQRLHGILCGIACDGKILKEEIDGLQNWTMSILGDVGHLMRLTV